MQGLENPSLNRFQPVVYIGNGALFNDIRGILDEIFIKEFMELAEVFRVFHGLFLYVQLGKLLKWENYSSG